MAQNENTYQTITYKIRIEGHLNKHWSEWFCPGGKSRMMKLTHTETGETVIRGILADQAALQGVLTKLSDLGLRLNSIVAVRKVSNLETVTCLPTES
jgi:hypothetical protein